MVQSHFSNSSSIKAIDVLDPPSLASSFRNVAATFLHVPKDLSWQDLQSSLVNLFGPSPHWTQDAATMVSRQRLNAGIPTEIRVAVTWQDKRTERQELYVYDVNISDGRRFAIDKRPQHQRGKRVTALDFRMGGVHVKSPLRDEFSPADLVSQDALGGIRVVFKDSSQTSSMRREVLVWGARDADNASIRFSKFDLMFSEDQDRDMKARYCGSLKTELHFFDLSLPCACPLHDYGYQVTIPSTAQKAALLLESVRRTVLIMMVLDHLGLPSSAPPLVQLFRWLLHCLFPEPRIEPHLFGSVALHNPPRRETALERSRKGMEELVKFFLENGMSDGDILEAWNNAAWSGSGRIALPDGWHDLRQGEDVKEMREEDWTGWVEELD